MPSCAKGQSPEQKFLETIQFDTHTNDKSHSSTMILRQQDAPCGLTKLRSTVGDKVEVQENVTNQIYSPKVGVEGS